MSTLYGIDSMAFVYHFEENKELGPAAGRLLRAAEEGRCRLGCSVVSLLEALVVPKRWWQEDLCRTYRAMFESFPHLSMLPVDTGIAEIASDLRAPLRGLWRGAEGRVRDLAEDPANPAELDEEVSGSGVSRHDQGRPQEPVGDVFRECLARALRRGVPGACFGSPVGESCSPY